MSSDGMIAARNVSKVFELGLSGRKETMLKIVERRLRHPIRGGAEPRPKFRALDDVSFDIGRGEAVGVIGKNGAGKSTLLKILSRITPPTSGYIDMHGDVGCLLEVGTGFHPELTGLENVFLNGTILGMTKQGIRRRLDAIVDFAEVHEFMDTPVKRYSSGMRVRLAFAVAAHLDPEILIVDEVLSVGDAGFQAKCISKMKDVASDDGRTVLYVSHNLTTLEHLCPRTLLLVKGRLDSDGPTKETIARYLSTFPRGERGDAAGVFDLGNADRSEGGFLGTVFQRLELRPGGGAPSDMVQMGERLHVELDVEGMDAIADPTVFFDIFTNLDQMLIRFSSSMKPMVQAGSRQSRERIVIEVPSVMLTPGEYYVNLHLKDGHRKVDHVRHAADFTVLPADYLGTGYQFGPDDGYVVTPWDWELRPAVPVEV